MKTAPDLTAIIADHAKWLRAENGKRANLRYANLSGADLSDANLRYADLSYADLSGANLSDANLRYADLSYANLRYANLRYADLSDANLSDANLRYADLSDANLSGANLSGANLRYADLSGANLSENVRWAHIGPVGQGRRTLNAWRIDDTALIQGGCFCGTFAEFRAKVTADTLPWDWAQGTPEGVARWRAECLHAADLLELAVA